MASTLEPSRKLSNGHLKTQPKSILKKSPRHAKKSTPVFFTGNEQSNTSGGANTSSMTDTDSEHDDDSSLFAPHHNHHHHSNRTVSITDPAEELFSKEEADEFQDLFESQPAAMPLRSSKLVNRRSARPTRRRRHQSAVYIFHSREINTEIIKILLSSTESFVKNFVKALGDRKHTEADIFRSYRSQFIDELREFLVNTDGHQRTMEYANKLGASLSEPAMYKMSSLRHEIEEHEKQKEKSLRSNHANDVNVAASALNDALNLYACASNSDPNLCGSLPTTTYLDAFTKELKLREIVLLKNLRTASLKDSLQRQDSVTLSHEHLNHSQSHLRSMKERNKCIVNAASTTRKIVRFADSFGLDLERVRIITNNSFMDAFAHDHDSDEDDHESASAAASSTASVVSKPFLVLIPLFSVRKSDSQLVKFDNYIYDYENRLIKCMVRVKNVCFEKQVFARITFNNWKSWYDLDAFYVKSETVPGVGSPKSAGQSFDYFGFCIVIPERTSLSSDNTSSLNPSGSRAIMDDCIYRIEFALCFRENQHVEHWDNNAGENYKFQCFFNK